MGLEANCLCSFGELRGQVKAHLESGSLRIRGEVRRDIPTTSVTAMHVQGDDLSLQTPDGEVVLNLGAKTARRWLQKLSKPPPSLTEKLGVGPHARALLIGEIDDPDVAGALEGSLTTIVEEAASSIAFVSTNDDLEAALDRHRALSERPIWIVHGRGRGPAIGEQRTRDYMRAAGFKDTKVSAVSAIRSATRYSVPPR